MMYKNIFFICSGFLYEQNAAFKLNIVEVSVKFVRLSIFQFDKVTNKISRLVTSVFVCLSLIQLSIVEKIF